MPLSSRILLSFQSTEEDGEVDGQYLAEVLVEEASVETLGEQFMKTLMIYWSRSSTIFNQ